MLADENKLVQALVNLCINAFHAMPEGGTLKLATKHQGNSVEIDIADTGVGIPPEAMERIFEPFYQVEDSLTREHGGIGLGLSIAKGMVELCGGDICAESVPGQGSRFSFTIPQEPPA